MKKYIKPKTKAVRLDLQSLMVVGSPKTYSIGEESTKLEVQELTGYEPGFQFRAPNSSNVFDDDYSYVDDCSIIMTIK